MVRFLSQGFYFSILPTLIVNRENSDFLRKISEKLFHKIIGCRAIVKCFVESTIDKLGN
jgi:hypothetical protein